tara:strand:+ start:704 stop:937 length:234 start_codon:yes stop_codon:yes gene_type:complete
MYKRIDMADFMKEISDLPLEAQEDILTNLSDKMIPIEIDGNVFMIHKNVGLLIDSLTLQLKDLLKEREAEFVREKSN